MSKTKEKINHNPEEGWEIKDRNYFLTGKDRPLTYTLPSKHSARYPLLWFNEHTGEQKAIRYATNQMSPFEIDQKGEVTMSHIVFRDGTLHVPKRMQSLQKLLSIYHPYKDSRYVEHLPMAEAQNDLFYLELEIEALNHAKNIGVDEAEAILRVEKGSVVSEMSSKEIKRDVLLFAKKDPQLFLDLAKDDNVLLRNLGIKAVEDGIINLSSDNRDFKWASNGRKLLTIPFEEHPYSALAAWFKTDEGLEVYKTIEKKLS
tara:strand:+ start:352 stop:1128 length:777 start_codon:yes stop_codon:yes gene_type:complete